MTSHRRQLDTIFSRLQGIGKLSILSIGLKSWLGNWQDWGSLLCLFLTLEIAVRSIEQAQWFAPQPSLTLVLVLSLIAGWLLVKSRLPSPAAHSVALILGAIATLWQGLNLLPQLALASRFNQLALGLRYWWQAISTGSPSEGTLHFALFLVSFTWLTGYVSIWFVLRKQNAWVGILLSTVTILVNLSNLPGQQHYFFFIYLLAAILLIGQTSLAKQGYWFRKRGSGYPSRGVVYFLSSVLCFAIVSVSIAWLTPETRVSQLETMVITKVPLRENIEEYLTNTLASIHAKSPLLKSKEQEKLLFGVDIPYSNEIRFIITSYRPFYWRTRMYDDYHPWGWTNSYTTEQMLRSETPVAEAEKLSKRTEITYTVITKVKTDALMTTEGFISSDILTSVRTLAPVSFKINLLQPPDDLALPPEVTSLARSLKSILTTQNKISVDEIEQLLPGNLRLASIGYTGYAPDSVFDSAQLTTIELTRVSTGIGDIVDVTAPYFLRPEQSYAVTASVNTATPAELSASGEDYPPLVTDYYLQLPPDLPQRVKQLSEKITWIAETPYDKALAIERYLSQINYSVKVDPPPEGRDGVDYFLFDQKKGNCVHFASAAAVMLRSVGIPSRLSVGYLPGEWDPTTRSTTVRAKHYHTWPEVYFPNYGWIGFDPTPIASPSDGAAIDINNEEEGLLLSQDWEEWMWLELEEDTTLGGAGTGLMTRAYRVTLNWRIFLTLCGIVALVFVLRSLILHRFGRFKGRDYASEVYRRMCFLASLLRIGPKPYHTPLEYRARLVAAFPTQTEAIDNIVQTYQESQFSRRKDLGIFQRGALLKSWRKIYPAFLKRLFRLSFSSEHD